MQKYALKRPFYVTSYNKLLSAIFKFGKKSSWDLALANLFENLYYTVNYTISTILAKIFIRLFTKVELVKAISRKRITFIPFFISLNRSFFLALKWIFLGALKNNTNTSFKNKLYVEFVQLLTYKSCFSIQKLEENNLNSFKNRSNLHYRWKK